MPAWNKIRKRINPPRKPRRVMEAPVADPFGFLAPVNSIRGAFGAKSILYREEFSGDATVYASNLAKADGIMEPSISDRIFVGVIVDPLGIPSDPNPLDIVRGWLDDPCNRKILLGEYDGVGIGMGVAESGNIYYVLDFVKISEPEEDDEE